MLKKIHFISSASLCGRHHRHRPVLLDAPPGRPGTTDQRHREKNPVLQQKEQRVPIQTALDVDCNDDLYFDNTRRQRATWQDNVLFK
jgi:hypothetical protein